MVAKVLGIPLDFIKVKPTNTLIGPNDIATGGSITSELVCLVSRQQYYGGAIINSRVEGFPGYIRLSFFV